MVSKVYYAAFSKPRDALEAVDALLKATIGSGELKGKKTAIKTHFGELGNYTHVRPQFIRRAADFVKGEGGAPFATDTTTLYPTGSRLGAADVLSSAKYNGFTEDGLGCPIVVADEPDGEGGVNVELEGVDDGDPLRRIRVAKHVAGAEAMLIVSHVKGHPISGFGAALKNLGMGCTTKSSKAAQHGIHGIVFDPSKCTMCGKCVEVCRFGALEMGAGGPVKDEGRCVHCSTCMFECESNAISHLPGGNELFQEGLAKAAAGVSKAMSGKPVAYINFLIDITQFCDCAAPAGLLVFQNVGILASRDPVAADKASLDLLDRATVIPGWRKKGPDLLGKLNKTDSTIQLRSAERLRVGSMRYELEEI